MTCLPLLQWIVLIVARIIQIAHHDYQSIGHDLRNHYIALQQAHRLAVADHLYDHAQLRYQTRLRLYSEMPRAQRELRDVFGEHLIDFRQRHQPDTIINVQQEVDDMFEWEIFLTDDVEVLQMFSDGNVPSDQIAEPHPLRALKMAIWEIEVVSIFAEDQRCYQALENAISIDDSTTIQPDVLNLEQLYIPTISFLDTWAIDFLNPITDETSITNAAIADAIQSSSMESLNEEQAALADHIMRIIALSTSVVAHTLRELSDAEWDDARNIEKFMKMIALRATGILDPLIQRRSTMFSTCRPRSILNDLDKSFVVFH